MTIQEIHYWNSIVILARELARADKKLWSLLSGEERNNYFARASNIPRQ